MYVSVQWRARMTLIKSKFIYKLVELTESDKLIWKAVEGKYVKMNSFICNYKGVQYELILKPENNPKLIITLGDYEEILWDGVDQLVKAVRYKEHTPWEIQEHIREVVDGIE